MFYYCERVYRVYPKYPGSISFLITGDEEGYAINGQKSCRLFKKRELINFCVVGEPTNPN